MTKITLLMMVILGILVGGMVEVVHAEFYVCGDTTQLTQAFYRDPSLQRPANCSQVPNNQVDAQVALIQSQTSLVPPRLDYLKVVSGLAVVKTQAEKDAVDAAIATAKAAQDALTAERANNIFCNQQDTSAGTSAIAARKTALYAQIDAIPAASPPTRATLVAALKGVVDELATISTLTVNCFTGRKQGAP
jgi:hypothetical protein